MAKSLKAEARNSQGDQLTVHAHDNDALILPVAQLEALHAFRTDLVGQISAIVLAVMGIAGGIYAGLHGQPWLGGTIVSVTIGTLAVTFLKRNPTTKG